MQLVNWLLIICSHGTSLLVPEDSVSKAQSNQFLRRSPRRNSFFEETKQGNLERECIEENCDRENASEVTDERTSADALWKILTQCKSQRASGKESVRACVDRLKQAHWLEWSAWSPCSKTCNNPRTVEPYRERTRSCQPDVVDGTYCKIDTSGKGSRLAITIDGSQHQREEAQTKACDDLSVCPMITVDLTGSLRRDVAEFRASWFGTEGADESQFNLFWYLNDIAVAKVPATGRPIFYNNSDLNAFLARIEISADYQNSYATFKLKGISTADFNETVTVAVETEEFFEKISKTVAEVAGH